MKNIIDESPDLLENLEEELKPLWESHQKDKLKSSIGWFIGMAILTIITYKFFGFGYSLNLIGGVLSPPPGEGLIESMIKGPVKFLELIGGIAGILMNIGFPLATLFNFIAIFSNFFSVKKKNYPKAPQTPEKTIQQYFSNIFQASPRDKDAAEYIEPYVCLLNQWFVKKPPMRLGMIQ